MSVKEKMTAIADAIRGKTGSTGKLTLDAMASAIAGMETGGGADTLDAFLDNSAAQVITKAKYIRSYVGYQSKIVSFIAEQLEETGAYALQNCNKLTQVSMPSVKRLGPRTFQGCTALEEISLPGITNEVLHSGAFVNCTALKQVSLPNMQYAKGDMFSGCGALPMLILPALKSIDGNAFAKCTSLKTLVLNSDTLVTLANISAFNNTPFASGGTGGTVYVPAGLMADYQSATNWSTLFAAGTCSFAALEGSEYA